VDDGVELVGVQPVSGGVRHLPAILRKGCLSRRDPDL
jgi:hypothetical protein